MHDLQEMAATRATFAIAPYRNEREDDTCFWWGTPPFCDGSCPSGYVERMRDPGGCWFGYKVFCCRV